MKKFFLVSILMGALPISMVAQDDDLYFVPKKKSAEKTVTNGMLKDSYYSGSNRSVDEYNRRGSSYEVIGSDSLSDVIEFSAIKGVYPDSVETEDFVLTKKMQRFEDYDISSNAAYWAGYQAGLNNWGWHSPWYYSRYGWYGGWYDPWYYGSWSLYDPWYWDYAYWYSPYSWGWGYPYGYYSYYHYGWGGYPYYSAYYGFGAPRRYSSTGNAGSINLRGGSRVMSSNSRVIRGNGNYHISSGQAADRANSLRNRTVGTSRTSTVNRSVNTRNNNTFNGGSRVNSTYNSGGSSFGGSSGGSISSGGGSRSVGGGGGSIGGGGGGPRGGRR